MEAPYRILARLGARDRISLVASLALSLCLALSLSFSLSCSGDDSGPPALLGRRSEVAAALGTNVIVPTYRRVADRVRALATATEAYAAAQTADNRDAARAAWASTMDAFEELELMQLGPLGSMGEVAGGADLRDRMYAWPARNLCAIDQETAGPNTANSDALLAGTVNQRGLGAIEYLLFNEATDNTCSPVSPINADGTWAAFTAAEVEARRATLAHSLTVLVARTADDLVARWDPAGGNFVTELRDPTRVGALYGSAQEALNQISDAMFDLDLTTKTERLGVPAGIVTSAACTAMTVCPDARESRFANRSKEHIAANLHAFQRLYLGGAPGGDELGFDDLLRDIGAAAFADDMAGRIEAAIAAVLAIEGTLADALTTDFAHVQAAYTALQLVTTDLKTMFVSVLDLEAPSRAAGDND